MKYVVYILFAQMNHLSYFLLFFFLYLNQIFTFSGICLSLSEKPIRNLMSSKTMQMIMMNCFYSSLTMNLFFFYF